MSPFGVLLGKELRVESRSREMITGGLPLAFSVVLLSYLAWGDLADAGVLGAGVLWIAFTFAGVLTLNRNLHRERDRGTWEALSLLPVDAGQIYLAKATANGAALAVVQAVAIPLYAILFGVDLLEPLARLLPVLLLGTIGLSSAGTLIAAASAHARAREILLPVLLLPFLVPLLMMTVQATRRILADASLLDVARELQLLAAMDAIFLAIGWLTFDHLLGE